MARIFKADQIDTKPISFHGRLKIALEYRDGLFPHSLGHSSLLLLLSRSLAFDFY